VVCRGWPSRQIQFSELVPVGPRAAGALRPFLLDVVDVARCAPCLA